MKGKLTLEQRIKRLEKLILEDIEGELDELADEIIKNNPTVDLDSELDDMSNIETNNFEYETIEDFIDEIIYDFDNDEDSISELKRLIHDIEQFNTFASVRKINALKLSIRELSGLSYFKAKKLILSITKERLRQELQYIDEQYDEFRKLIDRFKSDVIDRLWKEGGIKGYTIVSSTRKQGREFTAYCVLKDAYGYGETIGFKIVRHSPNKYRKSSIYDLMMQVNQKSEVEGPDMLHVSIKDIENLLLEKFVWRISGNQFDYDNFKRFKI